MMAAIKRVRRYVQMRDEKPLRQWDDSIHSIHMGTEWAADLRLSDLRELIDAKPVARVNGLEAALKDVTDLLDDRVRADWRDVDQETKAAIETGRVLTGDQQ